MYMFEEYRLCMIFLFHICNVLHKQRDQQRNTTSFIKKIGLKNREKRKKRETKEKEKKIHNVTKLLTNDDSYIIG